MKFFPNTEYILILPDDKNVTDSGIILPDSNLDAHTTGKVVAMGPSKILDDGTLIPEENRWLKNGDRVIYKKVHAEKVSFEDQQYDLVKEEKITGKIEE